MNAPNIVFRLFKPPWAGRSFVSLGFALLVFFGGALVAGSNAVPQQRDWQPQRTWVFVVGTLEWKHREMFESFPQKNRRDAQLVEFFRQQGVPQQQLVYLKDAQATTRQVKAAFSTFLTKAREGDLLFVYYCGHGYKSADARTTYFATFDAGEDVPGWSTDSIVKDVEKYFKGSRAFLTADCCYSGSLAQQARQLGQRVSFACLTSSSASQLSTANWTFTETLLAGLSGKPLADLNSDGRITIRELAEDVKADLAFAEELLRRAASHRAQCSPRPDASRTLKLVSESK
ncbi:MAG: caspase family protein [Pyrinomonadaceae bacterium]